MIRGASGREPAFADGVLTPMRWPTRSCRAWPTAAS